MALRRGFAGVGTASVGLAGAAFYYRPDPSEGELLDKQCSVSRRFKSAKVGGGWVGFRVIVVQCAVAEWHDGQGSHKHRRVMNHLCLGGLRVSVAAKLSSSAQEYVFLMAAEMSVLSR